MAEEPANACDLDILLAVPSRYAVQKRGRREKAERDSEQKEEDADALLRRCYFIYENQEPWLKAMFPAVYSYTHLRFYRPDDAERKLPIGELLAIPQGGDVLRQYTASGIFCDEAGFQPEFAASIRAAMPMIKNGGRIDCVSTAEPGYFEELCEGRVK